MSPITHALLGWCIAESVPGLGNRERALVVIASVAPDADGLGIVAELATRNTSHPLLWFSELHHLLAHNLLFAVLVGAACAVAARVRPLVVAALAFTAVHLHLLCDLAGSRGPDGYEWPIPYLFPFRSTPQLSWSGQWALNAWPNMAITALLLAASIALAMGRGYSPLVLVAPDADRRIVATLRARFSRRLT
jgi:inner membrane protein